MAKPEEKKEAAGAAAAAAAPKKKRTVLTPEQRIAALEQKVADEKAKLTSKDKDRHGTLSEKRVKLNEKIAELTSQRDAVEAELSVIAERVPELNTSPEK